MNRAASFFMRLVIGTSVATLAACSDSTAPEYDIEGTYDLRTMDGESLPVVLSTGDTLRSGVATLNQDSSFSIVPEYRTPGGTIFTTRIDGTWSASGNSIVYFSTNGQQIATGSHSATRITFVQANTFRFDKR